MSEKSGLPGFLVIALIVVCIGGIAAALYIHPFGAPEEAIDWNVTLIGRGGEEKILRFEEIKAMPSYEGYGGFFTTVGVINGPYKCKGVLVKDLCDLVGGLNKSNTIWVSASDGYLMAFSYSQVNGDFRTYDPKTFREVPHNELKLILMYEQDGALLPDYAGRPLRIAIISSRDKYLTEGHNWVKWVDKIEVRTPTST